MNCGEMNEENSPALGSAIHTPAPPSIENHRASLLESDRNAMTFVLKHLRLDPKTHSDAIAILEAALMQHPQGRAN